MNIADINGQRIKKMETNMKTINKELFEIKKLLKSNVNATNITSMSTTPFEASGDGNQHKVSIWNDTDRLAAVKAKPAESVLVINKATDSTINKTNTKLIEKTVVDSRIPVKKAYKNKEGNLVVVCESEESRNSLKQKVSASNANIEMRSPKENRPVISIVGLTRKFDSEEVIDLLMKQNHFLRQFSMNNEINDHIKVFNVKPLRENQEVYQAFARVSKVVRQGFRTFNDKVTMGLSTCKIYVQYHVKRCNNCQGFGHFYKNCPNPDSPICAKCGDSHSTKNCSALHIKCSNCIKDDINSQESEHRADDPNCPSFCKQQQKIKDNLNWEK